MRFVSAFLGVVLISFSALAQTVTISEEEVENRARDVGQSIRCVVCQNQSIDESDASLAQDMRKLVRTRIRQGDSNDQVMAFMQNRYGDFVLLKPPVQSNTYFLWFAPGILMVFFLIWYVTRVRKRPAEIDTSPLNEDELKQFEKLTSQQGKDT